MTKKKIASEIAIGSILFLAMMIGGAVLNMNKNIQASPVVENKTTPLFVAVKKAELKTPRTVVFLGDSITALGDWSRIFGVSYIKNAGIRGNTTDDVLARLNLAISSKPEKLFLMIGINDFLRGKDVSFVFANYEKILNAIRAQSPDTIVYVQSVLPINNDISKIGAVDSNKILELNNKLKSLADEKKVFYIDLYSSFCGLDNKMYKRYAKDGVHPDADGYAVWKNLINQLVQ